MALILLESGDYDTVSALLIVAHQAMSLLCRFVNAHLVSPAAINRVHHFHILVEERSSLADHRPILLEKLNRYCYLAE